MLRSIHLVLLVSLAFVAAACSSPKFVVEVGQKEWFSDNTSISPELSRKNYRKIMVIPPFANDRGKYDEQTSLVESEFIKRSVTVFSAALTARVVTQKTDEAFVAGQGKDLDDVERALIMAKSANAEALLQIGSIDWIFNGAARYFIWEPDKQAVRETTRDQFDSHTDYKWQYTASIFRATGRLIDVITGEVMASFRIDGSTFNSFPETYRSEWAIDDNSRTSPKQLKRVSESSDYDAIEGRARLSLQQNLFSKLADHITGANAGH
jgi:hypothetical protein